MYQKMISYIYDYENGEKNQNIGFAKLAMQNQTYKLRIQIKNLRQPNSRLLVYGFVRDSDGIHTALFGELQMKNGVGECYFTGNTGEVWERYRFLDMGGFLLLTEECVKAGKGSYFCATQWEDGVLKLEDTDLWKKRKNSNTHTVLKAAELDTDRSDGLEEEASKESGANDAEDERENLLFSATESDWIKEREDFQKKMNSQSVAENCGEIIAGEFVTEPEAETATSSQMNRETADVELSDEENSAEDTKWGGGETVASESMKMNTEWADTEVSAEDSMRSYVADVIRKENRKEPETEENRAERAIDVEGISAAMAANIRRRLLGEAYEKRRFDTETRGRQEVQNGREQIWNRRKEPVEERREKESYFTDPNSEQSAEQDSWAAFEARRQWIKKEYAGIRETVSDNQEETTWGVGEELLRQYSVMNPFFDDQVLASVRMEPKDIGNFPMEFWYLANNSFLLHGYYCYRHLLFMKMRNGEEVQYAIAVPGKEDNRERFMANMFGFEQFKRVKKDTNGGFGYWWRRLI